MNELNFPAWTRRKLLGRTAAAAGAGMLGLGIESARAEPPPETTSIRLSYDHSVPILCYSPILIAEQFLRLEGFTEVKYAGYDGAYTDAQILTENRADIGANLGSDLVVAIDKGAPVVALAGLHVGCSEIFAQTRVKSIRDLAGRRLLATTPGVYEHIVLSSLIAFVGLDVSRDVEWVWEPDYNKWPDRFAQDHIDVMAAFPPMTFMLREMNVGHVILNTTLDDPWRNFFCCMVMGRSEFVRRNPVATKRAIRAIVKANQLCDQDREGTAKRLVELGVTDRKDFARRALDEVPFGAWRDFDPSDTLRFFSLRLREAGMIKSSPRQVLDQGTNFSFLDEVRRELKT